MVEVYTKKEVDDLQQRMWNLLQILKQEVEVLKAGQSDWITLEEAIVLAGRSENWFRMHRNKGDLPIAYLPRTEGSSRYMYSRADCVAYGRKRAILPPVDWAPYGG